LVNQEALDVEVFRAWHSALIQIVNEVLIGQHLSEFGIEWTAIRNESTSSCYIANELVLHGLELITGLDPSGLVVSKRVDQSVCLVHLSLRLLGLLGKRVLVCNLCIELSLKRSF
jgi:hypothetical protein